MSDICIPPIAERLTPTERAALLSLPVHDRGDLPEEVWWAYYSILDEGLADSDGNFTIVPTPLGTAVRSYLHGR